jgi:hypothetical protein
MAATQIQCGVTNNRINREPIDSESVIYSYDALMQKVRAENGFLYGGQVTSVVNDLDSYRNGPYYISYNPEILNSYSADRIVLKSENDLIVYGGMDQPKYTYPSIYSCFYSPLSGNYLEPTLGEITQEIEIGSYFTPSMKIYWPCSDEVSYGTRQNMSYIENPSSAPGNYVFGYSYGLHASDNSINVSLYNGTTLETKSGSHLDTPISSDNKLTFSKEALYTIAKLDNVHYQKASYMFYTNLFNSGIYFNAYGNAPTSWFNEGTYKSSAKYNVDVRYRYYYGFSDTLPINKEDLQKGYTHLLNNSSVKTGTLTTCVVKPENAYKKIFWIAYPNKFGIAQWNNDARILLTQPDGVSFDLMSGWQNMKRKVITISLGMNNMQNDYNLVYCEFEYPIGNPAATLSFRILPVDEIVYIENAITEDGTSIYTDDDTGVSEQIIWESANGIIMDDEVWK